MAGKGRGEGMDASFLGKRKSSKSMTSDSDSDEISAKILAKDYAVNKSSNEIPTLSSDELTVILRGRTRPMKHWHPTTVNNAIRATIGECDSIKLLPSGDLAVTRKRKTQV